MRVASALFILALLSHPGGQPFNAPPDRYDDLVNLALQQVGSDLRVRQITCITGEHPLCRFGARQVEIDVTGPKGRSGTDRITVAATFRRNDNDAAKGLMEDALTVLGATMVTYDPRMAADRRSGMLLELGGAALNIGEAHLDSADVHYSLSVGDVSGRLEITAATLRAQHA